MMHVNSMETYQSILDTLPEKRAMVMRVIVGRPRITRQDVAAALGVPINEVTGRIRELLDDGLLQECGKVTSIHHKPRALLQPVPLTGQRSLF